MSVRSFKIPIVRQADGSIDAGVVAKVAAEVATLAADMAISESLKNPLVSAVAVGGASASEIEVTITEP